MVKVTRNENVKIVSRAYRYTSNQDQSGQRLILQGVPKSNPLGKILYLWNCSNFFRQINSAYRGGFRPHILQISLPYLLAFQNYNYLNLNVHFSKWTSN